MSVPPPVLPPPLPNRINPRGGFGSPSVLSTTKSSPAVAVDITSGKLKDRWLPSKYTAGNPPAAELTHTGLFELLVWLAGKLWPDWSSQELMLLFPSLVMPASALSHSFSPETGKETSSVDAVKLTCL